MIRTLWCLTASSSPSEGMVRFAGVRVFRADNVPVPTRTLELKRSEEPRVGEAHPQRRSELAGSAARLDAILAEGDGPCPEIRSQR